MTIRQLEIFIAVVEEESLTEAARALMVSPSAVSQGISELEERMGAQLLIRRRGRGAFVTAAGYEVYRKAREITNAVTELERMNTASPEALVGNMNLGCFTTLSPWLFPPLIQKFGTLHPGLNIRISESGSRSLQRKLVTGELDAIIVYRAHLQPGVEGVDVANAELKMVLPESHALSNQRNVRIADVANEKAILLDAQPSASYINEVYRQAGISPTVAWRSKNVETIRALVGRGLGYSILMGQPHGNTTYEGAKLVYRDIGDELPPSIISVAYPQGSRGSAKVKELIRILREEFSGRSATEPTSA